VDSTGPWAINVLTVDLTDPGVMVSSGRPAGGVPGRERTSAMLERRRRAGLEPLGAVNADFYAGPGYTISTHVMDGEIVQTEPERPSDNWSSRFKEQFGVTRGGRVIMERTKFAGLAIFENGGTYRIAGINTAPARTRGITVRTSACSADSSPVERDYRSLLALRAGMRGDTVLAAVSAEQWERTVRLGGEYLALQWDPDSVVIPQSALEPGDTLRLVCGLAGLADPPEVLIGGLPRIVIDGRLNPALLADVAGPPADFARKRHPRSGVGVTRDSTTLLLVTVDGRQARSAGMSLEEFGNLMLSLGIHQGLNLDGGGSTTMVFNGAVVNSPSDPTGERAVANCLVVLRKAPSGPSSGERQSHSAGGL
jgi:hypothetical protein